MVWFNITVTGLMVCAALLLLLFAMLGQMEKSWRRAFLALLIVLPVIVISSSHKQAAQARRLLQLSLDNDIVEASSEGLQREYGTLIDAIELIYDCAPYSVDSKEVERIRTNAVKQLAEVSQQLETKSSLKDLYRRSLLLLGEWGYDWPSESVEEVPAVEPSATLVPKLTPPQPEVGFEAPITVPEGSDDLFPTEPTQDLFDPVPGEEPSAPASPDSDTPEDSDNLFNSEPEISNDEEDLFG